MVDHILYSEDELPVICDVPSDEEQYLSVCGISSCTDQVEKGDDVFSADDSANQLDQIENRPDKEIYIIGDHHRDISERLKMSHDEASPPVSINYNQYKQKMKEYVYEHHILPSISEDKVVDLPSIKVPVSKDVYQEQSDVLVEYDQTVTYRHNSTLSSNIGAAEMRPTKVSVPNNLTDKPDKLAGQKPSESCEKNKNVDEVIAVTKATSSAVFIEEPTKIEGVKYAATWQNDNKDITTTRKKTMTRKPIRRSKVVKSVLTNISNNTHINKEFFDDLQFSLPNHMSQKIKECRRKLEPLNPNDVKRRILLKKSGMLSKRCIKGNTVWTTLSEKFQDMILEEKICFIKGHPSSMV